MHEFTLNNICTLLCLHAIKSNKASRRMGEGNAERMRVFLQKGILRNMLLSILETLFFRDKEVEVREFSACISSMFGFLKSQINLN